MDHEVSYNRVIYKGQDDQKHKEIADSLAYDPPKIEKYKLFSPHIFQDEISKKKRLREDEYIKHIPLEDRPILVINDKHMFKNAKYITPSQKNVDKYYKVSKNTEVIETMELPDETKSKTPKRNTRIHGANEVSLDTTFSQNEQKMRGICKINGVEFLPPGFIELEPLLFKDEYTFSNNYQEKVFEHQQRRLKLQRQKQYGNRNELKKRDVSIFVLSEFQKKVNQRIKNFIVENKRRMTVEEKLDLAHQFESDPLEIEKIETEFIEHNKITNFRNFAFEEIQKNERDLSRSQEILTHSKSSAFPFLPRQKSNSQNKNEPSQKIKSLKISNNHLNDQLIGQNDKNTLILGDNKKQFETFKNSPNNSLEKLDQNRKTELKVLKNEVIPLVQGKVTYKSFRREIEKQEISRKSTEENLQPFIYKERINVKGHSSQIFDLGSKSPTISKSPQKKNASYKDIEKKGIVKIVEIKEQKLKPFDIINNNRISQNKLSITGKFDDSYIEKQRKKSVGKKESVKHDSFNDYVICREIDKTGMRLTENKKKESQYFVKLNLIFDEAHSSKTKIPQIIDIQNSVLDDTIVFPQYQKLFPIAPVEKKFLTNSIQNNEQGRYFTLIVPIQSEFYLIEIFKTNKHNSLLNLSDKNRKTLEKIDIHSEKITGEFFTKVDSDKKKSILTLMNGDSEVIFQYEFLANNTPSMSEAHFMITTPDETKTQSFVQSKSSDIDCDFTYKLKPVFIGTTCFSQTVLYKTKNKSKPILKICTFDAKGRIIEEKFAESYLAANNYFSELDCPPKLKGNKVFAKLNTVNNFGIIVDQVVLVFEEEQFLHKLDRIKKGDIVDSVVLSHKIIESHKKESLIHKNQSEVEKIAKDSNFVDEKKSFSKTNQRYSNSLMKRESLEKNQFLEEQNLADIIIEDSNKNEIKQTISQEIKNMNLESLTLDEESDRENKIKKRTISEIIHQKMAKNYLEEIFNEHIRKNSNFRGSEINKIQVLDVLSQKIEKKDDFDNIQTRKTSLEKNKADSILSNQIFKEARKTTNLTHADDLRVEKSLDAKIRSLTQSNRGTSNPNEEGIQEKTQEVDENGDFERERGPTGLTIDYQRQSDFEKQLENTSDGLRDKKSSVNKTPFAEIIHQQFEEQFHEEDSPLADDAEIVQKNRTTIQSTPSVEDNQLREKLSELFNKEKDLLERLSLGNENRNPDVMNQANELFEEFYEFCKIIAKTTPQYEESVFFVSLFYYFLEKKNYVKEEGKTD